MNTDPYKEEIRLQLLRKISEAEQTMTQRELAEHVGISLGKTNYWIAKMVKEGLIQIERFKKTGNKSARSYTLTPKGMEEKFPLLVNHWNRKLREYNVLRNEVDALNQEILQYSGMRQAKVEEAAGAAVFIAGEDVLQSKSMRSLSE